MRPLRLNSAFVIDAMLVMSAVHAISPGRVEGEESVRFEKGAVALSAAQRDILVGAVTRVLRQQPCQIEFGIAGYGDAGLGFLAMRSLALERAQYIRSMFERQRFMRPSTLYVGGDLAEEVHYLGTGSVWIAGYLGELGCGRQVFIPGDQRTVAAEP